MQNEEFYEIFKGSSKKDLNWGYISACQQGSVDKVKYLLSSPDLNKHADIHAWSDLGFTCACVRKNLEIIEYLIFDMNIEKTKKIEKYLKNKPNEQVKKWFRLRELNNKLEQELYCDRLNNKKLKV